MDRVFLDANVLFSAAYRADSRLTRLWPSEPISSQASLLPPHVLLTSAYAVAEAHRNLSTTVQQNRLTELLQDVEIVEVQDRKGRASGKFPYIRKGRDPLSDLPEKDRPILEAAIAGGATHLLTGDINHFGQFFGKRVGGVRVLPPAAYFQ